MKIIPDAFYLPPSHRHLFNQTNRRSSWLLSILQFDLFVRCLSSVLFNPQTEYWEFAQLSVFASPSYREGIRLRMKRSEKFSKYIHENIERETKTLIERLQFFRNAVSFSDFKRERSRWIGVNNADMVAKICRGKGEDFTSWKEYWFYVNPKISSIELESHPCILMILFSSTLAKCSCQNFA